jgi:hypothetical protein
VECVFIPHRSPFDDGVDAAISSFFVVVGPRLTSGTGVALLVIGVEIPT